MSHEPPSTFDADELIALRKRIESLESTMRPFRDMVGLNGIKVTVSDSNMVIDGEELKAGDGDGNAIDAGGGSSGIGPTAWIDKTIIQKVETLKTLLCEATIEAICNPDGTITVTLDFGPTVDLATLCAPPEEE